MVYASSVQRALHAKPGFQHAWVQEQEAKKKRNKKNLQQACMPCVITHMIKHISQATQTNLEATRLQELVPCMYVRQRHIL